MSIEIFLYRVGSEKVEKGFSFAELPKLLADDSNVIWVDMFATDDEERKTFRHILLNIFKFHHLTVEDCLETRNQPKIEPFNDYVYMIVHGVKPKETNHINFVTKELDIYLGKNYLVTFHAEEFRSIEAVKHQIEDNPFACKRGAAYLLHQILDVIVDLYAPIVDDFDAAIENLETRVLQRPKNNNRILEELMDIRRSVARMRRISSRQLEVLNRISHGEFPQIPATLIPFFRDVHDHLLRISDLADSYRDFVSSLFDIHFSVVASKTNEIMKTLAICSTIILPLSLIAGIYGMNFENMPELRSRYAYFIVLGTMLSLTLILLGYFWHRGWIFQRDDD